MATVTVNRTGTTFTAGSRYAPTPTAPAAPAKPAIFRASTEGLRPGTVVEFRKVREPGNVHQAVVVFNSEGLTNTPGRGGRPTNGAFASLNDNLNTIWRHGVDTVPGTFRVIGTLDGITVNPR